MLNTLKAYVGEYKKTAIAAPVFIIFEVIFEMIIPLLMAEIIDNGLGAGNINYVQNNNMYNNISLSVDQKALPGCPSVWRFGMFCCTVCRRSSAPSRIVFGVVVSCGAGRIDFGLGGTFGLAIGIYGDGSRFAGML